uniref:Capsid protein n=1 Tax=Cauliflower mosaic virus TaxID=10641 RepID=W8VV68_9VIRU|nr:capsid protein [Cauliflower mosaic virus]
MAESILDRTINRFWYKLGDDCLSESQFDLMIRLMEESLDGDQIIDLTSLPSDNLQVEQVMTTTEDSISEDSDLSEFLLAIGETSEEESDSGEEPEFEQVRMDRTGGTEIPKEEDGEPSRYNERKRKTPEDRYFPTQPKTIPGQKQTTIGMLNIDCQANRRTLIDDWAAEIGLIVKTNREDYLDPETILLLMEHKTSGIAKELIRNTRWNRTTGDIIEQVINAMYTMFLGLNYSDNKVAEKIEEQEKAKIRMTKLQLCDICYLEEFTCDYEKNMYKTELADFPGYINQYLSKIPIIGEKALTRFRHEANGTSIYSLGFAAKIVKEELSKICDLSKKQKKLKKFNKKCCSIGEASVEYGCKKTSKKKYHKRYKKKYKAYKPYKKKKKFRSGKYFKPKEKKGSKQKYCPKGKKDCRCWICNIEGHYANECPNRQSSEKAHILQQAEKLGLQPIEEPYEGVQEVFILEYKEEEEETSTEEDDGSSTSEDSDSDSD